MPGYRGHLIGGGVTYFILLYFLSVYNPDASLMAQGLLFCLVGALFPDIDIKSMGQKYFYIALTVFLSFCLLYGYYSWFVALTFVSIIPLLVRHRGIFHSLFFICFLSAMSIIAVLMYKTKYGPLAVSNALFFIAGAWSHILLDRFTTKMKKTFGKSRR
jgi:membrane-bound metal-dependent hydrolase YbcI (DUF457 family)